MSLMELCSGIGLALLGLFRLQSHYGAVKREMKTTTKTQSIQRVAELKKGGEYKIFFLLVFSVFSVPLW